MDLKDLSSRSPTNHSTNFILGAEFGIKVVGGRMSTGGFIGVCVAKVMIGSSAEQGIKEGKHKILSFSRC